MDKTHAKILVLNDDPDVVEALGAALGEEGYAVELRAQHDIDDVIAVAPDVILIDCPPGAMKSILNFVQRLRLNRATASIPLLIGVTSVKLLEPDTLRNQMIHILVRPFELDDLLETVRELVALGKNVRAAPSREPSKKGGSHRD